MATVSDVEQVIRQRLEEISEQLSGVAELQAEQGRLERALAELRGEAVRTRSGTARPRGNAGAGTRAPRGSNQRAILQFVEANPEATTSRIVEATGISRGVVYSALSRLVNDGRLRKVPQPDGQVAYAIIAGA